jgi:hypothetical protein
VLTKLADALAPEGVAYIVQLSILSQRRTANLLALAGMEVRVVEYGIFPFTAELEKQSEQVASVERLSDAGHIRAGDRDLLVAYLLEIRPQQPDTAGLLGLEEL